MLVCAISKLKFKVDEHKHTVYYAETCKRYQFESYKDKLGSIPFFIANDLEDAIKKAKLALIRYFDRDIKISDFEFTIAYSQVDDNEFFWGNLSYETSMQCLK